MKRTQKKANPQPRKLAPKKLDEQALDQVTGGATIIYSQASAYMVPRDTVTVIYSQASAIIFP
jgi:hypothetical protein